MRRKFVGLLAGALIAVSAFGAVSASAATEFGDNCTTTILGTASPPATLFDLAVPGNPLPITAPSGGVVTKWKVNAGSAGSASPSLRILRQTGAKTVQVIGESGAATLGPGLNTFDTRITIQAGDRVALSAAGPFPVCQTAEDSTVGGFVNSGGVGSTNEFLEIPTAKARIPVFAVIEPDADNDGYGDETQDKCPQNAAFQVCPVVALSTSATAKKGLANVLVTTSSQAAVTVSGTVRLGKGKGNTATLSGGTQVVLPGVISKFTLLFTQKLKAKLKQLNPKQSLTLSVTATAPNVVGAPSVSSLKVKLKGQKKPKKHTKPKGQS
jgi:hypothetical protein